MNQQPTIGPMTELLPNAICGEVPKDTFRISIVGSSMRIEYGWKKVKYISLPPGNWRILCTYPDCTEQEAAEVVEYLDLSTRLYRDYDAPAFTHWFVKPNDSLTSLLRSKGLGPDKNYLIIKKEQQ